MTIIFRISLTKVDKDRLIRKDRVFFQSFPVFPFRLAIIIILYDLSDRIKLYVARTRSVEYDEDESVTTMSQARTYDGLDLPRRSDGRSSSVRSLVVAVHR